MKNTINGHQEYEELLKTLLEKYDQENYPLKKVFEDLRRERKKIVQERYLTILNKL